MSGHSKWANIKHRKGKSDAARAKIFTKIGREITVAVRSGGADAGVNGRLRDAIAKAKQNNMPSDNVARSIKRASGELGSVDYETIFYEGYADGGVAVIVETLTDNKNRTASDVRHAFEKYGSGLGSTGSVSYLFERKGVLVAERRAGAGGGMLTHAGSADSNADGDALMLAALEAGAEDVIFDGDAAEVLTSPNAFSAVRESLEKMSGIKTVSAEIDMLPANYIVPSADASARINRLLDALNDLDDVQNVWHNAEIEEDDDED